MLGANRGGFRIGRNRQVDAIDARRIRIRVAIGRRQGARIRRVNVNSAAAHEVSKDCCRFGMGKHCFDSVNRGQGIPPGRAKLGAMVAHCKRL